jgi:hypothetical protein
MMESVSRRLADVHKKMLAVVIRWEQDGQTQYEQRQFGTTRHEIEHLAAWLRDHCVSEAAMERRLNTGGQSGTGWKLIFGCA